MITTMMICHRKNNSLFYALDLLVFTQGYYYYILNAGLRSPESLCISSDTVQLTVAVHLSPPIGPIVLLLIVIIKYRAIEVDIVYRNFYASQCN